ncbi:hypothetical protein [Thorsellia kenyensis]|uniref:Uncharacterized protein n=1 Tax=Thorsellia kenyensis TaxID=1549888 RepID=A0ABV6C7S9_9GAMM
MKPAIPQLKSFENVKTLGYAFQKMYENYPQKAVNDVIDEFTLMRIERESKQELKSEYSLNGDICLAYIAFFRGDVDDSLNLFKKVADYNFNGIEVYLTILSHLAKFKLYEKELIRFSSTLRDNLLYMPLVSWFAFSGDIENMNELLDEMSKKQFKFDVVNFFKKEFLLFESLLSDKSVSIEEYKKIRKYMIRVLENNQVDFSGQNIPTCDSFIVLTRVDADPDVISNLNSELSVLMAEDDSLSFKLTAGFTSILPSYGVILE